jgi:hypothetical protein
MKTLTGSPLDPRIFLFFFLLLILISAAKLKGQVAPSRNFNKVDNGFVITEKKMTTHFSTTIPACPRKICAGRQGNNRAQ